MQTWQIIALYLLLEIPHTILHEYGHVLMAKRNHVKLTKYGFLMHKVSLFSVIPFPVPVFYVMLEDEPGYPRTNYTQLKISLGGLVVSWAFVIFFVCSGIIFSNINLLVIGLFFLTSAFFNTLPLRGFDGWKMWKAIISILQHRGHALISELA